MRNSRFVTSGSMGFSCAGLFNTESGECLRHHQSVSNISMNIEKPACGRLHVISGQTLKARVSITASTSRTSCSNNRAVLVTVLTSLSLESRNVVQAIKFR